MSELKGTDEEIIADFNGEKLSASQIANKYHHSLGEMKARLAKLQRSGIIGYKDRSGKVITKPGDPSPRLKPEKRKKRKYVRKVEVPESSLSELLEDVKDAKKNSVSKYHKELLIEVLHKIIC